MMEFSTHVAHSGLVDIRASTVPWKLVVLVHETQFSSHLHSSSRHRERFGSVMTCD